MAKKSAIEKNKRRARLVRRHAARRDRLRAVANDRTVSAEERYTARLKLAEMPRNSSQVRVRNRCHMTGRPRGFYRKFGISRMGLRELALKGQVPGMTKSSW